jgi:endonuclease G
LILPLARPIVFDGPDELAPFPKPWEHLSGAPAANLRAALSATGAVIGSGPVPWIGCAFLVGKRRVLTARHVVEQLPGMDRGVVGGDLSVRPDSAYVGFGLHATAPDRRVAVSGVRFIHPWWDLALLELAEDPPAAPLRLATLPLEAGAEVVAVMYPVRDPRSDLVWQDRLLGSSAGTRAVAPGRLIARTEMQSFGRSILPLAHDASVTASSGAPLVDPASGFVVGIGFAGAYQKANHATPAWELARDPVVRRHGVRFADDPPWLDLWEEAAVSVEPDVPDNVPADLIVDVPLLDPRDILPLVDQFLACRFTAANLASARSTLDLSVVSSLRNDASSDRDRALSLLTDLNQIGLVKGRIPMIEYLTFVAELSVHPARLELIAAARQILGRLSPDIRAQVTPSTL